MALAALIVRIGADVSGFNKALSQTEKDIQKAGRQFSKVGASLSKNLVVPIVAVGAALAASAVKVGSFADELLDLVDMTGLSARTLQEFRHVALVAGVESDTLANAAIKLTTAMSSGDEQGKKLGDALGLLGIKANDASGKLISMDVLLPQIVTGLQGMTDTTSRNALAADIFGKSWAELAPILSMTSGEMGAARAEAQRLGLVMSDEALQSADDFRKALGTLTSTAGAVTREIGVGVIPVMTTLASVLQEKVVPVVRDLVDWFGDLSSTTKITIGVAAGLAVAFTGLVVTLGVVLKFVPLLTVGFALLTSTIGLTILAVAALTAAGLYLANNWDAVRDKLLGTETAASRASKEVGKLGEALVAVTNLEGKNISFSTDRKVKPKPVDKKALAKRETVAGQWENLFDKIAADSAGMWKTLGDDIAERWAAAFKNELSPEKLFPNALPFSEAIRTERTPTATKLEIAAEEARLKRERAADKNKKGSGASRDSIGTKVGQVLQAGAGSSEIGQMVQAFASFGPMAVLLPVINGAMEKLGPAFTRLIAPLVEIGGVIGETLAPVFEMLAPVVKMIVGVLSTGLAPILRIIVTVFSYVIEAIGWFIKGLGIFIDKIVPDWISKVGKGLAQQGQEMIDNARASRKNANAMEQLAKETEKVTEALINVPFSLNLALYRRRNANPNNNPNNYPGTAPTPGGGSGGPGTDPNAPELDPSIPQPGGDRSNAMSSASPSLAGAVIITGNVYVNANDPEEFIKRLGQKVEQQSKRGGISSLQAGLAAGFMRVA